MECIHFPESLEAVALVYRTEFGDVGRPILRELCAQRVRNSDVGNDGGKQRGPLGERAPDSDAARRAALYGEP
jgi:hypothetical protein